MSSSTFAARLRLSFGELSIADISRRTGINAGTLSRLLNGIGKPSFENVIRIARTLGDHPAKWFDLSGQSTLAFLLWEIFPEQEATFHEIDLSEGIHRRVQAMVSRGLQQDVDGALNLIESRWEFIRGHFEELAREAGAPAACLIADHRIRGDVLFSAGCDKPQADQLAQAQAEVEGWRLYSQEEGRLRLRCFLKIPGRGLKPNERLIRAAMVMWSSGLRGVWRL